MKCRRGLLLGVLTAFAIAAAIAPVHGTVAAFRALTSNAENTFQAADTFPGRLRVATGSYTGNGSDNRAISEAGFQPDLVIVKADSSQVAVARTATMSGDAAKPLVGATAPASDLIQSLTTSGFTIGTDARVNADGVVYHWTAFRKGAADLAVGSYTGNGTSQGITGAGFSPEYVAVLGATAQASVQRFTGMSTSFHFDADTGATGRINSLDSDGFSVGSSSTVNSSGTAYHYIAFNNDSDDVAVSDYLGVGIDTDISVGFSPKYVAVRANDTTLAKQGRHRPASMSGPGSLHFTATGSADNGIRGLASNGFQVGTDATVNGVGVPYHYLAVKDSVGCSQPGTETLTASHDSWLDQAAPTANMGSHTTLDVTSKAVSRNARAVVRFNLPLVPAGCSVVEARLRMYNRAPTGGRTLHALRNAASWSEKKVTWSNQPDTAGTAATALTPLTAAWMDWTVTAQVQEMYSVSNHGFKIRDASEDAVGARQTFDSSEASANKPQLLITFG